MIGMNSAVADLLADLQVPGVTTAQFALIEPDLDCRRLQCLADALGGLCILRCVAQEYGPRGLG
jgi:hypothetical protein